MFWLLLYLSIFKEVKSVPGERINAYDDNSRSQESSIKQSVSDPQNENSDSTMSVHLFDRVQVLGLTSEGGKKLNGQVCINHNH